MDAVHVLLIEATDSDAATGYSMLFGVTADHLAAVVGAARFLNPSVVGWPLLDWGGRDERMRQLGGFLGAAGLGRWGRAAHAMALEDLWCKHLGITLGALMGRRRDAVPAYGTGLFLSRSIDELIVEAAEGYERGLRAFKVQVGSSRIEQDRERLDALVGSVPAEVRWMAEAGQCWTLSEAIRAARALEDYGLVWLEDPLRTDQRGGYPALTRASPVPIAAGETEYVRTDFEALQRSGISYVIADLGRVGGARDWWSIADALAGGASTFLSHLYPHMSLQLVAALPQPEVWVEYVDWFDPIAEALVLSDGLMLVADEPGTGFKPNLDAVDDLALGPWLAFGPT